MPLRLQDAETIIAAARKHGRDLSLAPLTIVVLDPGGHVIAAAREDGSGILRFAIAHAKAYGGLGMGMGSRALAERAAQGPAFVTALGPVSEGRMMPVPGGVLAMDGATVAGAVGISGDLSDKDEACAIAGIEAAGFSPKPGA